MKKITLLYLIVLLAFQSCLFDSKGGAKDIVPEDFKTQTYSDVYQIDVPKYMKATNDLNDEASMQYQNIYKENYLAIIEESKEDFVETFKAINEYDDSKSVVENYKNAQIQFLEEGMQKSEITTAKPITINGLNALQTEIVGRVDGVIFDIYYLMTFVEGKDNMYMIMTWTLKSKKDKYKNVFEYMAETFKEIN